MSDAREPAIILNWIDRDHVHARCRIDFPATGQSKLRAFSGTRIAVEKAVKDWLFNTGFPMASKHVLEDFADSWKARYG